MRGVFGTHRECELDTDPVRFEDSTHPTSLATTVGLENPGDVASFKVFVLLTTGNEAGSNTVTITRP